jgi:hypothetical protein
MTAFQAKLYAACFSVPWGVCFGMAITSDLPIPAKLATMIAVLVIGLLLLVVGFGLVEHILNRKETS